VRPISWAPTFGSGSATEVCRSERCGVHTPPDGFPGSATTGVLRSSIMKACVLPLWNAAIGEQPECGLAVSHMSMFMC
jgi:hypothetical protein